MSGVAVESFAGTGTGATGFPYLPPEVPEQMWQQAERCVPMGARARVTGLGRALRERYWGGVVVRTQAELDEALRAWDVCLIVVAEPGLEVSRPSVGGAPIMAEADLRVTVEGRVHTRGDVHVVASGGAQVWAEGRAEVTAWDHGYVCARDRARVTAHGRVGVEAHDRAVVHADGSTTVHADGEAHVTASGAARVRAAGRARVTAHDTVKVDAVGDARVDRDGRLPYVLSVPPRPGPGWLPRRWWRWHGPAGPGRRSGRDPR
ncbi:hypothetical protein AB0N09_34540 [Streptomyces erythrochromogenes]|uniref:hypothetical protein n=1 Tax=Streptomyces erythrochromogenes TaxID=285574 RepID=UPI003438C7A9